ncbi:polymorphic toxin-type HINT domain-containing protein [Paenibacillus apiarius]|uniref:HINT domain-containing protein n=2 Tax=Paenibacillus apiarius TaxID=46240 RepID=A0ABT4DS38_9BACL|nr:polymorphic toxin-type HINT domain-containing protein [Paenibacillus apiarius]MCY9514258.1 HINT domain-containing protein [Paenibacillus apiarius]MCY9520159.1 HINT domain-containing protein [Paenibacillus apiarius]MCY9550166.1 HINT domain-containing protein [Paenibacillus apiarius]MCY9560223.1 HINT domain-containing protein [Paenibacillus apiarius]MCY9726223.1 HINT domain-containing protein [Paenibacillus apiarius]
MKKLIALMLFFILSFTSILLASAQSIANCNLHCFSAGTPVQTKTGFKPIEQIRIGDFVLTKDELTGKTGYNTVIELYQRQAAETYQITVKRMTITTTEEHPFWVPGQGWVEAQHLKTGDLLQNPEGKSYPIKRIEIKNDRTTVYNFRVQGVHNYFVTELEIWTHNCGAGGIRNVPMRAPTGGGSSQASTGSKSRSTPQDAGTPNSTKIDRDANNNITKYSTYGSDGKIQKEVRIDGRAVNRKETH